jgi:hypothetical protein
MIADKINHREPYSQPSGPLLTLHGPNIPCKDNNCIEVPTFLFWYLQVPATELACVAFAKARQSSSHYMVHLSTEIARGDTTRVCILFPYIFPRGVVCKKKEDLALCKKKEDYSPLLPTQIAQIAQQKWLNKNGLRLHNRTQR